MPAPQLTRPPASNGRRRFVSRRPDGESGRRPALVAATLALLLGLTAAVLAPATGRSLEITAWSTTAVLPDAFTSVNAQFHGDRLYIVGGKSTSAADFGVSDRVYLGQIESNGEISGWTTTRSLPSPLFLHATLTTSDHLYVFGGFNGSNSTARVWRAPFLAGGGLGSWERLPDLPQALHFNQAVLLGNRIYVLGGYRDGELFDDVYLATVTETGITDWTVTRSLPERLYRHHALAHNGTIYVIGGRGESDFPQVYMAQPDPNGYIRRWIETTSLPSPRSYHGAVIRGNRVVVIGGRTGNAELSSVISAPIQSDGTLGGWSGETSLPTARYRLGAATAGRSTADPIYVSPGMRNEVLLRDVYRSGLPPTPTPTATATRQPTPTPGPAPDLTVTLLNAPRAWIAPGQEIQYQIRYRNASENELTEIEIAARIPEMTILVNDSVTDGDADNHSVAGTNAGDLIIWQIASLPAAANGEVSYRVQRVETEPPPVPFALDIGKDGPAQVEPGEEIRYTLTISNLVPISFTNLLVEDRLPDGAVYLAGGNAPPEDGVVRWTIDTLPPESTAEVDFAVTAGRSIVNVDYQVTAEGGTSAIGREPVITQVGDTPLRSGVDGVVIENDMVIASWQQNGRRESTGANAVSNPSPYDLFLPYVTHR